MNDYNVHPLTQSETRRLQFVLLEMLLELDRICKKHDIRYCIIAGTLLGAVRHKGFIPWDDDLDVAMIRGEYERFREICEAELDGERFFFQDNTTDMCYFWGYGRLRRKDSVFVRVGQEHLKMKTGIFLDIFPIDNVPDFPPLRALFAGYCFFLRKVLYARVGVVSDKRLVIRVVYRCLKTIPIDWAFNRLSGLQNYGRNRETKYARILTFPTPKGRPFGYLRKWYIDTVDIEFETHSVAGIRDWDEYLTYKFGDYMTKPPPEQQHGHPAAVIKFPSETEEDVKK
jgi:lipopolysaccharide cholinephosphotransferase